MAINQIIRMRAKNWKKNTLAGQQFSSKPFRAENVPLKNIVNEDL
jgi:hypothetical protein